MYDLRNISGSKYLRAAGLVLFGALCAFQVNAAPFTSSTSGNSTTFAPGTYARDAAAVGASLAISAGVVYATQSATLKTLAGAVAPLVVRAAPVAGAIGSAVAGCFANPLCVVATAAAAAYVANELSFNYSTDPVSGAPLVKKLNPNICTVSPCYEYRNPNVLGNAWATSAVLCAAIAARYPSGVTLGLSGSYCVTNYTNSYGQTAQSVDTVIQRTVPPSTDPYVPSTSGEFSTAIGAKTDWAADSKITDLLEQIVRNTNQSIPLQIPSVTGPTSIVETPTVQTKADGTKTTTSKTTSIGYLGPTATATQQVVETSTSPTGVITTTSTTESPAYVEEKAPATDYDIPGDEIPRTKKTITFSAENLGFAGGACPANVMQTINGKTIKLIDWTSNCGYVTTYAKPMILAAAVFAALMIIFVGGKPE